MKQKPIGHYMKDADGRWFYILNFGCSCVHPGDEKDIAARDRALAAGRSTPPFHDDCRCVISYALAGSIWRVRYGVVTDELV